jgi:superfamily II DNA or RNA helicase
VNLHSPPAEKIALFRSLFRGREDVHPQRFESRKSGRAGYSPACGNEWVRGICEKPRIKCSDCSCQAWLAVTDEVVRQHLSGEDAHGQPFVIGVYPMLLDETCFFLAVDFDGESWRGDAAAYLETCRRLEIPAALERSRSGEGGHVWLFFAEAVPAGLARKLGAFLLTETMESRPGIGLKSYDRFFPNQDTLPKGGFGNLIALPLQKHARDSGNTLFLDETFTPHPDQWAFLAAVEKISRDRLEKIARDAELRGRVLGVRVVPEDEEDARPWTTPPSRRRADPPIPGPLPDRVEAVLADQIYIANEAVPPGLRNRLLRLAAFQNPEFYRAQAMRMTVHDKPRIIACAEQFPCHFAMPRGCLDEVTALFKTHKVELILRDARCRGEPLEISFHGELRDDQQAAAAAMLAQDFGVLAATTAFGKTVLAAWLVAQRKVNTLVLVHRQQLLEQWVERLSTFLEVPAKSIGRLGGGRKKLTGSLDVALLQSLVRKEVVDDRVGDYGHLIVDECHHLSARSFELVVRRAKARFVTGLSATVTRKDGHHPIIFMQCGPIRHRVDARKLAATRPFTHKVFVRPTGFRSSAEPHSDPRLEYQCLVENLATDESRNRLICTDVENALHEGRSPLVLTERTEHLLTLAAGLAAFDVIVLRGGLGRKELRAALARLAAGPRVVLATGRFVGEGFDDPRLDTLFLALPVSWRGTIAQYAGRLHRLHEGKREVRIYDYPDLDVPMLSRMFDKRCRGYEAVGYEILLPASAVPGWPTEVPLPIDPQWKKDYAASVRRLISDGVGVPLANLFVHAARHFPPDAHGVDRARSASETFLFRRLETLPQTKDLFRLNAELAIPFDNAGKMEVDFLSANDRLVIELDGAQHLGDAEAYRRDRRKDALLQRHGYFVLRFLAEDAGKKLDEILDAVLAALVHLRPLHSASGLCPAPCVTRDGS